MQHVLVLQYEEESSYRTLIKCNFCNFTLWIPGTVAPFSPLCTPLCFGIIEI